MLRKMSCFGMVKFLLGAGMVTAKKNLESTIEVLLYIPRK